MNGHHQTNNYDIFISYCHKDNESFPEPETGWVSDFYRYLNIKENILVPKGIYLESGGEFLATQFAKVLKGQPSFSGDSLKSFLRTLESK